MIHRYKSQIPKEALTNKSLPYSGYQVHKYENLSSKLTQKRMITSLSEDGFLVIQMPKKFAHLRQTLNYSTKKFFELDISIKRQILFTRLAQSNFDNIGYFPYATEQATSHKLSDLKEFVHIGRKLQVSIENLDFCDDQAPSLELMRLLKSFYNLFLLFDEMARNIFLCLASAVGLSQEYVSQIVEDGASILRNLHYPPVVDAPKAQRAAPHFGMNLIGMQLKPSSIGLQHYVQNKKQWVFLNSLKDDQIVINIGRMFSYLTNGRLEPSLHKVINPVGNQKLNSRYSSVLFYHGNNNAVLRPMSGIEDLSTISIGDWISSRLKDIKIHT